MSTLSQMLRIVTSAVVACLALACAPLPYKAENDAIEAENKKNGIKEDEPVILYGYDENAPRKAPETCKEMGRVEASSLGEKSFPDGKFRKLAKQNGGNGVTRIKANGKEVRPGGHIIVDADTFTTRALEKLGWATNPLEDGTFDGSHL